MSDLLSDLEAILNDTFSKLDEAFSKVPDERKKAVADTIGEAVKLYSKDPALGSAILLDSTTYEAIVLLSLMDEPYKSLGEEYLAIYEVVKRNAGLGNAKHN